jgi:hypothetical protein
MGMKKISSKVNGAKTSPTQGLNSAMAMRRRSQEEISELRKMLAEKSARRVALETAGDINNAAVISELGRLQVFVEMLPRRIAFKEEEYAKANENLLQVTNEFINGHLGPCIGQVAARMRTIVEKELSTHFGDQVELKKAVMRSDRVRRIEGMHWFATSHPMHGPVEHAERTLKAWADVDEFERTLLVEESIAAHDLKS